MATRKAKPVPKLKPKSKAKPKARPKTPPPLRIRGTSKRASDDRELIFVEAYLTNGENKTQAAIAAGCPDKGAAVQGQRLFNRAKVQAIIAARHKQLLDSLKISTERTLRERARGAYYDIGELAKASIKEPADIAKLPEDIRQAITGWKWDKDGNLELRFADKHPHLTALEKHQGLYKADNEQQQPPSEDGIPKDKIQVARAIAFVLAQGAHELAKQKLGKSSASKK